MPDNSNKKIQFNLDPEIAQGVYANIALIVHSPSEFIVDFAAILPGVQKADVRARVILAPEHAKRVMLAMQDNIRKYEKQYGTIQMQGEPRSETINPFSGSGNQGEA
ncbi:MAG: DUF3467 domain-containing protein [Prevotella sp.]|nr:DUF3467 domain-containing protein [Prevotella sp.]